MKQLNQGYNMAYTIDKMDIIDYPPEELNNFLLENYEYIDNLHFSLKPDECLKNSEEYVSIAKKRFLTTQWEGDGEIQLLWIPPFMLKSDNGETAYFNEESKGIIVWHVKQQSDGISFILMPQKAHKQLEFNNINSRIPIVIEGIGLIYGRDAIFLENCKTLPNNVIITGKLNGNLCKDINQEKDISFELWFENVISFETTELDFYDNYGAYSSSFEEYCHSAKIKKFKELNSSKLQDTHRHFVVYTYD